ncbi:hypothetical protein KC326_g210 [Hortaea werneckii]|nr:hypothetical protein KC326_g210 [Hortaea werneckii]
MDQFLKSVPHGDSEYMNMLRQTQAFNEFIHERESTRAEDPSIKLFDEIILSKRNRGRTSLFSRSNTSFLSDTSDHLWRNASATQPNGRVPGDRVPQSRARRAYNRLGLRGSRWRKVWVELNACSVYCFREDSRFDEQGGEDGDKWMVGWEDWQSKDHFLLVWAKEEKMKLPRDRDTSWDRRMRGKCGGKKSCVDSSLVRYPEGKLLEKLFFLSSPIISHECVRSVEIHSSCPSIHYPPLLAKDYTSQILLQGFLQHFDISALSTFHALWASSISSEVWKAIAIRSLVSWCTCRSVGRKLSCRIRRQVWIRFSLSSGGRSRSFEAMLRTGGLVFFEIPGADVGNKKCLVLKGCV